MIGFGVDIGGSGIKGAPVDLDRGVLTTPRHRIPTPQPAHPQAVAQVVGEIVEFHQWEGPIGCAVPSVVRDGIVRTAANIDDAWLDLDAARLFRDYLGREVAICNDADAAAMAEMRFGAGRGQRGVVILLTFGTGIGSAVYSGGQLVPNTEFGHMQFEGMEAEHYAAARLVEVDQMPLEKWALRVNAFLEYLDMLFTPDLVIFGGGISSRFGEFEPYLNADLRVTAAALRNNAGIVGAATAVPVPANGDS